MRASEEVTLSGISSKEWTANDMLALGRKHAELETRCDLEGTMSTMVAEPVYEFHPMGLRMAGNNQVRRYYTQLFEHFIPSTRDFELIEEWVSKASVAQEYRIEVEIDGVREQHHLIGILYADGELLGGERVFASERVVRLMVGDLFDELTPVHPSGKNRR
jgi:hypothetical protein